MWEGVAKESSNSMAADAASWGDEGVNDCVEEDGGTYSVRGGLMVLHRGGIFVESLVTVAKVGGS